jgi:membrane protein YqaA with SNARE-associated domain
MPEVINLIKEFLIPYGIWGLLILSFLDSTFVPMPQVNDLLVITLSISRPHWMIFYAFAAVAGSLLGTSVLYYLGRKGGQAFIQKKFSKARVERVQHVLEKYDMVAVMVAGVIPPPFPYKVFIFVAGALQFLFCRFVFAVLLSRSARFYFEGIMAGLYGDYVIAFMKEKPMLATLIFLGFTLFGFLVYKVATNMLIKNSDE